MSEDGSNTVTAMLTNRWTRQRLRVHVVDGPDAGLTHDFDDVVRIGKQRLADLVLTDSTVSGLHCELVNGDALLVRDLGSKNGTFVGTTRVVAGSIPLGESVRIGATVLQVRALKSSVTIPLYEGSDYHGLIGISPSIRAIAAKLEQLSTSAATVLVQGETGTGKEVLAEALHRSSERAQKPLVVVDCASLPTGLVESELMGHERGAFTGAVSATAGAFERADGGTLFLDEIGELPLAVQPKLLRLLESRTVRRVGGQKSTRVDVRILAATNRDLAREVQAGRFREDLYYRLAVVKLEVPPLRERRADIPILAAHFLRELGLRAEDHLDAEALHMLTTYDWPGNVRELRNHLTRLVVIPDAIRRSPAGVDGLTPPGAPLAIPATIDVDFDAPLRVAKQRVTDELERRYVGKLLEECGGRVVDVARRSGMDRMSIYRIIERLKLT